MPTLNDTFSKEKVRETFFSLGADKAQDPNGFIFLAVKVIHDSTNIKLHHTQCGTGRSPLASLKIYFG